MLTLDILIVWRYNQCNVYLFRGGVKDIFYNVECQNNIYGHNQIYLHLWLYVQNNSNFSPLVSWHLQLFQHANSLAMKTFSFSNEPDNFNKECLWRSLKNTMTTNTVLDCQVRKELQKIGWIILVYTWSLEVQSNKKSLAIEKGSFWTYILYWLHSSLLASCFQLRDRKSVV